MKAKANRAFLHDQLGRVEKDQEFEATEAQLSGIKRFVNVYQTKVIEEAPINANSMPKKPVRQTKAQ